MPNRWVRLASLGLVAATLGGGVASANSVNDPVPAAPLAIARAAVDQATLTANQSDDAVVVAAGTLDDGRELLPLAQVSLDEAIAAAQAAVPGATSAEIGEVDLEYVGTTLVFNVDIGHKDVKVDAATGSVVSADLDD
jgi:uncharacterized membrane protein YkoI